MVFRGATMVIWSMAGGTLGTLGTLLHLPDTH
jgi:hypothetical protein